MGDRRIWEKLEKHLYDPRMDLASRDSYSNWGKYFAERVRKWFFLVFQGRSFDGVGNIFHVKSLLHVWIEII